MDILSFVNNNLLNAMLDIGTALGLPFDTILAAWGIIYLAVNTDPTGLLADALFVPLALWWVIKNAASVFLSTWYQAITYLQNNIIGWWGYVVNTVQWVASWVGSAANLIVNLATVVWYNLSAPFRAAWSFAEWVRVNGANVISQLVYNASSFVARYANPLIQAFFAPYANYINWLISLWWAGANFLLAFARNPSGFVNSLARTLFNALIQPFQPLLSFLSWWVNSGAQVLTRLVNNPAQFILQVIEPHVIAWVDEFLSAIW